MDERNVSVVNGQLSYIMRNVKLIPVHLATTHGSQAVRLDLSENCLRSLSGLEQFTQLEEVILDSNGLTDATMDSLPRLPKVHTLSLNKNKLKDLDHLLGLLQSRLPRLSFLSLLGNEACPDQLTNQDSDDDDYRRYRLYALYKLPQLRFLDSSTIKESDRAEARQKGPYLGVVRVSPDAIQQNNSGGAASDREAQEYRPLPVTADGSQPEPKAKFGKCRYVYYGRHSEGNRFIRNNDL
jgi:hypothetical protein